MSLSLTGNKDLWAFLKRNWEYALYGRDNGAPNYPVVRSNESVLATNAAGTGTVSLIKADGSDVVTLPNGATVPAGQYLSTPGVTGNTVDHAVFLTVTLTQLKAGQVIVPAVTGRTLTVTRFRLKFTGNFTTATSINLSDTAGTPVDIATVAIANATNGNILTDTGGTGLTIGTFGAALTASQGIQLRDVAAGTAAGGTSVDVLVHYTIA